VTDARVSREPICRLLNRGHDPVGRFDIVFGEVVPDVRQILFGARRQAEALHR